MRERDCEDIGTKAKINEKYMKRYQKKQKDNLKFFVRDTVCSKFVLNVHSYIH